MEKDKLIEYMKEQEKSPSEEKTTHAGSKSNIYSWSGYSWIGLSIRFEKWIWTWIDNHLFAMDLDWIDNPKNRIEQQPARG